MNSDSNFDEKEEIPSGDSEDDYSGSESDAAKSENESSDVRTENSEDTEGMDWDEMER